MSFGSIILLLVLGGALLAVSRQRAALMLLIGASYVTLAQEVTVGPFHFTFIRVLIGIGMLRVVTKGERIAGGLVMADRLMLLWGLWLVVCSAFHEDPSATLIGHLGVAYDGLGLYFLFRIFIQSISDVVKLSRGVLLILMPIAVAMVIESVTGRNSFFVLNGAAAHSEFRAGHFRAQGPFAGSIMAGTVGGVCLPLAFVFWQRKRNLAIAGLITSALMVITCRSSGPIMTAAFALGAVSLWKMRDSMRSVRWTVIVALVGLALVMDAPVYYLMARIDFTGSSTGYHRAALIESTIKHWHEWWLTGTDYTRHWMPTGLLWSPKHTDITNHYIRMGVLGGLPLMLLFIGIVVASFMVISKALKSSPPRSEQKFVIWTLGSILFAHAMTFFSVSYWDQSICFLYLCFAVIAGLPFAVANLMRPSKEANVNKAVPKYEPSFSYSR